ncbi:uncharacterized protein LOC131942115 [Physella acuta]|uniref:uncharacterized protein LOC131942115 n=1 Tax=Physella acuta TaxID=109671 RepID=UPI0027DD3F04|nr:uncharacterized protein LOC131942115 [Physella acuta]
MDKPKPVYQEEAAPVGVEVKVSLNNEEGIMVFTEELFSEKVVMLKTKLIEAFEVSSTSNTWSLFLHSDNGITPMNDNQLLSEYHSNLQTCLKVELRNDDLEPHN